MHAKEELGLLPSRFNLEVPDVRGSQKNVVFGRTWAVSCHIHEAGQLEILTVGSEWKEDGLPCVECVVLVVLDKEILTGNSREPSGPALELLEEMRVDKVDVGPVVEEGQHRQLLDPCGDVEAGGTHASGLREETQVTVDAGDPAA